LGKATFPQHARSETSAYRRNWRDAIARKRACFSASVYDGKKITALHPTLSSLYVTTLAGMEW
jgi:hypothetical protein